MQKIKISSLEGKHIAANIYTPAKKTGKLVILCPGYLHSKDYEHLDSLAREFVNTQYTAVTFDPVGTWESGGEIGDYTVSEYLSNIQKVLEYMLLQESFSHIVLGGHSRGGGVSILYAVSDPRISEVLAIMPSPQSTLSRERFQKWIEKGFESSFQKVPKETNQKEFQVPFSYVNDRAKYNVLDAARDLKVPVVFVIGENDDQIPAKEIEVMFNSVQGEKKIIRVPGAGHIYWENEESLRDVNKAIFSARQN